MTFFAAGAAAVVSAGTTMYSAHQAGKSAARQAGAQSRAEGEAVQAERLNYTIRNSYNAAFNQMQLGMQKRKLSAQRAGISAAKLMAKGDASAMTAASGSIGATSKAIAADIDMKAQAAVDMTTDTFENAMENANRELDLMVINTAGTTPNVKDPTYMGPTGSEMMGMAVATGIGSFASSYASNKMSIV